VIQHHLITQMQLCQWGEKSKLNGVSSLFHIIGETILKHPGLKHPRLRKRKTSDVRDFPKNKLPIPTPVALVRLITQGIAILP